MKNKILLLIIFIFISIYSFAQSPVPAPQKNGMFVKEDKFHRVEEAGMCKDGLKSGTWKYFEFSVLQKEEDFNANGILIATRIFKYRLNEVEMFSVVNTVYEGKYSRYYSNSIDQPIVNGWYTSCKKDKTWSFFRKLNGNNLWRNEIWQQDVLIETDFFYTDGKLFKRNTVNAEGKISSSVYYDKDGAVLATMTEEMIRNSERLDSLPKNNQSSIPPPPPPPQPGSTKPTSRDTSRSEVFTFAEQMPDFPGGINSFIRENIRYPVIAKEAGISGTVYISFIINIYGEVTNVYCIKGVPNGKHLEAEAIRVIEMMSPFIPGTMGGKPVPIQMTMPVKYTLQ